MKDEYNTWTSAKRSMWFTTMVEVVAYFLMWRFLLLGKNACLVWRSIITAALDLAKAELSLNGSIEQKYDVEFSFGSHPSAIHKYMSPLKRLDLDLAISQVHREKLQLFGGGDDRKVTFFADTISDSENYPDKLVKVMKRELVW